MLFASGTAALVHQVLWIKQLSLVVGVDIYAVTMGVSAFFAGLALGGVLFGWRVDCRVQPFRLYSFLEFCVAVLGVATRLALARAAQPFAALEAVTGPLAWTLLFALVIGLGTGITAGALLRFSGLEQRVCAELLPVVVRASSLFQGNFNATADPRIDLRWRDGRRELLQNPQRYDLITLEPPSPSAAGVANLYSSDFYTLASTRLRPEGLLAQWWRLPTQNDEDSRALVRSFLDVFPHVSLWTTEFREMLLIGSFAPIELDAPRIAARFDQREVAVALREVGIASPAALLATWVTDQVGLERYVDGAPPVTDDRPRIEYASWVRQKELRRVLPRLLALHTTPLLRGAAGCD